MAKRLITSMKIPDPITAMFTSRALLSAKDILSKTEVDLMEILDLPLLNLSSALDRIQEYACPSHRSVLTLCETRNANEVGGSFLATNLKELDDALHGGIPSGLITEIVGESGVGKTQFCLMLSARAAMPSMAGGLDRSVIFIDTEHTFSSSRMMEIAQYQSPILCGRAHLLQQLAEHVLVLRLFSLSELMKSLERLEEMIIEHAVGLVIIDSIAALLQSNPESDPVQQQEHLGKQAARLKLLAESFQIPFVVANQVRAQNSGQWEESNCRFELDDAMNEFLDEEKKPKKIGDDLNAALGMRWAHAANIRLLLEFSPSGLRNIQILKSPLSALANIAFSLTPKGLEGDAELEKMHLKGLGL